MFTYNPHCQLNKPTNKLNYLEGVRGLAAFIVLITHLKIILSIDLKIETLQYFISISHSTVVGKMLNSFVEIIFDGKLAVQVFWFMSGYVISIKLFNAAGNDYLLNAIIKRYFRLAIPALGSVLLVYGLLKFGLMYNTALDDNLGEKYRGWSTVYDIKPNFFNALRSGLWDSFFNFKHKGSYNPILWTMTPELYGSFFCFFLFAVFKTRRGRYFIYSGIALIALFMEYYWLVTFILGFFLCDIDHTENGLKKIVHWIAKHIFSKWYYVFGIVLILIFINGFGQTFYSAYAGILVSAVGIFMIINSNGLRRLFQHKILVWLGKISFSLYLIHLPIICSLSCYLLLNLGFGYFYNGLISVAVSMVFILFAAALFTKWVDSPAVIFSNWFAKFILTFFNNAQKK